MERDKKVLLELYFLMNNCKVEEFPETWLRRMIERDSIPDKNGNVPASSSLIKNRPEFDDIIKRIDEFWDEIDRRFLLRLQKKVDCLMN